MAKFYGPIGYSLQVENKPGLVEESIVEHYSYGEVLRDNRRWNDSSKINDDLVISNRLSIVADDFVMNNAYAIRYVVWMGSKWKISSIDIEPPRLILDIGGLYNGPEPQDVGGST